MHDVQIRLRVDVEEHHLEQHVALFEAAVVGLAVAARFHSGLAGLGSRRRHNIHDTVVDNAEGIAQATQNVGALRQGAGRSDGRQHVVAFSEHLVDDELVVVVDDAAAQEPHVHHRPEDGERQLHAHARHLHQPDEASVRLSLRAVELDAHTQRSHLGGADAESHIQRAVPHRTRCAEHHGQHVDDDKVDQDLGFVVEHADLLVVDGIHDQTHVLIDCLGQPVHGVVVEFLVTALAAQLFGEVNRPLDRGLFVEPPAGIAVLLDEQRAQGILDGARRRHCLAGDIR